MRGIVNAMYKEVYGIQEGVSNPLQEMGKECSAHLLLLLLYTSDINYDNLNNFI